MRRFWVLLLAVLFTASVAAAQGKSAGEKKEKKAAPAGERWSGDIIAIDKAKSTLTIQRDKAIKVVEYNSATQWTKGDSKADGSEFKQGVHVACYGDYDKKSGHLVAKRIDLRPPK